MILTRKMLDTRYAWWFHGKRNTEQAKEEILKLFSEKPAYGGDKWSSGRSSVAAVRPSGRFNQRQLVRS